MINSLLVYDSADIELGSFFQKCGERTNSIFASIVSSNINIDSVSGKGFFSIIIPIKANIFNVNPFVFVSFTHGTNTELLQNGKDTFISITDENNCLKNSFTYCFACHAGKDLGLNLIEKETLTFIGYKDKVKIQKYFGAEDSFVDCAIAGIKPFAEGLTAIESKERIVSKYNECIDRFYLDDMLTATLFMDNRDALVVHGNEKLRIGDLMSATI